MTTVVALVLFILHNLVGIQLYRLCRNLLSLCRYRYAKVLIVIVYIKIRSSRGDSEQVRRVLA